MEKKQYVGLIRELLPLALFLIWDLVEFALWKCCQLLLSEHTMRGKETELALLNTDLYRYSMYRQYASICL